VTGRDLVAVRYDARLRRGPPGRRRPQHIPPQDLAAWEASARWVDRRPQMPPLSRIQPILLQRLAPTRHLVTQSFSGASTRDAPGASRGPARSGKPRSDNSGSPVSRASGAGSPPCWLSGTRALSSISGGVRCAVRAYTTRSSKGTCVFGSVSWTDMMTHNRVRMPQVFRRE